jgi:hypothetical protein
VADPASELTASTFEPHAGSEFAVCLGDTELPPIRLVAVARGVPRAGAPRSEPFSLEFVGPAPALEQRTYQLQHPALGSLEIFVVPVGLDDEGVRYEAIFN